MLIVGCDPGSNVMGYGVIRTVDRGPLEYVTAGVITARRQSRIEARLDELGAGLEEVVGEIDPNEVVLCGIEAGFGGFKNGGQQGAVVSAAARGIALRVLYRRFHVEVRQYQPATVKLAACGRGDADKGQVARMIAARLGLNNVPSHDAADALAVCLCRAHDSDVPIFG